MKIKYFAAFVASSVLTVGVVSLPTLLNPVHANPCAGIENPCAAVDPCAANPCAAADPCAANPCAAADPCAANPCAAADPCAAKPCAAADPCAANPCAAADPCAADPCAANPCAAADVAMPIEPPHADIYVEETSGLAIRGADPVAYFTESAAVMGSADYEYEWNGATWRFSSAANKEAFKANPEAYAPQYGGYCAKAVSEGNLASVDPRAWKIVDGKLYLNYSADVQAQWVEDIPGNIEKANSFWPEVLTDKTLWENRVTWAQ
ncbi:MAG: YHS domain-containing protein [Leptolyngbya sp. SIO1E4]|nr:YHS domain-containing protein [Leptolyngbya sp. SIO1E4]